jgi:hypothetical protein
LKKNPSTASTVVSSTATKPAVNKPPPATNLQKVDPTKNTTKPGATTTAGKNPTANTQAVGKPPSNITTKNPPTATKAPIGAKGTTSGSSTSRAGVKGTGTPQVNKGKTIPGSGS